METTSQTNGETQGIIRLLHQTEKTLPMLNYNNLTDESVKSVLKTFAGYELNHKSTIFSVNKANDVTTNLTNVSTIVQNPLYHDNSNKPVIWLRRFMKAHNVDYVKDSN